jgi:hypothetical protein
MPRARALVVRVEDRPGVLGEVATALGEKKVNLRAVHGSNEGGQGILRLVVDKFGVAKRVLAARGWQPHEEEILEIRLSDRPGTLGEAANLLGAAGVNITYAFVSAGGGREATVFLAVSDMKKALRALR